MSLKLYTDQGNPAAWKILVAAKYAGVNIDTPSFEVGVDNKTPAFEKKSPTGKVPVLETAEGSIFEANAAARFVARQSKRSLFGATPFEAAQVDNWIDFAATEIDLPASVWILPILGVIPNNALATQRAKGDIRKVLEVLNAHLGDRTFLVGERISLADIVVATSLHRLYEKVLDAAFRKAFVNANRWFTTIVNQPEYVAVAGQVTLADKMQVAPAAAELPAETKKAEKPKAEKPKEEKPKEEKPKKESKPKEEVEEDFEETHEEPKKKSILDSLPPSKLNLDEWKRTYSNEDTRPTALPWLWKNFDKEGYSFWSCDYKYNHELTKVFMTANLISGFLQRLDKLRKYAFGSLIIFGDDGANEVSGIWMFRGQNIPEEMSECDDAEHYEWKKLNSDDSQQRELIEDYFAWDGKFGGRTKPFNQGKIYK
jgi:elongation factor 1-gamma